MIYWQKVNGFMVLALVLTVFAVEVLANGPFGLGFDLAGGGGGTSSGGGLTLRGVAGQPVVASSQANPLVADLKVRTGFWHTRARTLYPVGVELPEVPLANRLNAPYPNPFNPATNIRFELAAPGPVRVKIYDARGQLIRDLVHGEMPAGRHEVLWNGKNDQGGNASSGMYFIRFEAGQTVGTMKMTLLK